jgi:hypothetical protein
LKLGLIPNLRWERFVSRDEQVRATDDFLRVDLFPSADVA